MDPLSIAASVVEITVVAAKLIQGIGRFTLEVRSLPDSIAEFYESVHSLELVLDSIDAALRKRKEQLSFERNHHTIIKQVLESCHRSLKTLEDELPQLSDYSSPIQKIRQSLEKQIKQPRIQEILSNINQRTTVLQLSLTTLEIGAQASMQKSQDQIQTDIRQLTDNIKNAKLTWTIGDSSNILLPPDSPEDMHRDTLSKEIRDWRQTADDVATAVSLNGLDGVSLDDSRISLETLPACDEDGFDPEPELTNHQSHDVLELQYEANQDYVQRLVQCHIFLKASAYQKRGIELREQLSEKRPFQPGEQDNMKETLADILLKCETPETDQEGKTTLQKLLKEEVARDAAHRNPHRRCRLYHKLGSLYLRQNSVSQARKMLSRAFDGRKAIQPMPRDLVEDSAEQLIRVLQRDQAFDEARGIREWIRREIWLETTPPATPPADGHNLSKLYQWCQDNDIDIEAPTFRFDMCDMKTGKTPLHRAIEHESLEVLTDMLSHVVLPPETPDARGGSTPLLTAAATKNRKIVKLLLECGAVVDVKDNSRMTPLHRSQSQYGGLHTAELLLGACPSIIDEVDNFNKTALYLACEKGNEKMVRMLSRGANPNIQGPGLLTPLIIAVEVAAKSARKIAVVELLVRHGADPSYADSHKRTAFDAASNAGLAASEIKKLLDSAAFRRFSNTGTIRNVGARPLKSTDRRCSI
ncbi:uncharacterized protein BCR38DRAFT_245760 [Pseudomassariella vexata]|uniref:Uncharacterized protein n=1 Tax=Pseudomassariella vexata TaxID=1141098 RepID=A0A1Y2DTT3_9PEZI|nr:uncharacterized protein BCR38DRAFT_245760 [Pseudomassariella vexata]ORY62681.1 hypothetical protein BCR38DRAFT_245760 [Pseudomassariella vexata]